MWNGSLHGGSGALAEAQGANERLFQLQVIRAKGNMIIFARALHMDMRTFFIPCRVELQQGRKRYDLYELGCPRTAQ